MQAGEEASVAGRGGLNFLPFLLLTWHWMQRSQTNVQIWRNPKTPQVTKKSGIFSKWIESFFVAKTGNLGSFSSEMDMFPPSESLNSFTINIALL